MSLVISLSTIPPRFAELEPALEGLLRQTAKVDEIRLYVPKRYRRFPEYDGSIPAVPKGIRVIQPEEDLGPATKVLFAAQDLAGTDTDLIYCDDDRLYPPHWFEGMIAHRGDRTNMCVATCILSHTKNAGFTTSPRHGAEPKAPPMDARRAYLLIRRKIKQALTGVTDPKPLVIPRFIKPGFGHIAEGLGAVLVRPEFFDAPMYDIPPILWAVDDIWLSGHFERQGIPIWCIAGFDLPLETNAGGQDALYRSVIEGADRSEANSACVKYMQDTYGIWR